MDDFSGFNITIVGLGLIGGSYAMSLKKMMPKNIWAIDKDRDTLEAAVKNNVISEGFTDAELILPKSDIVILSLYPKAAIDFVRGNMKFFKSGCLITDVCGIKKDIVTIINSSLRKDVDFIGGHPMAGKELSGFISASDSLFFEANYFITPTNNNSDKNINLLKSIICALGCKKIISLTPEEHDRIIAYTSHLPHLLAISLINCLEENSNLNALIGGSFRDATRVADINSELWIELINSNKENALSAIDSFIYNLNLIKQAIIQENRPVLHDEFNKAKAKRKGIS